MDSPPTGPGRTLIMTRTAAIGIAVGLICTAAICGWFFSAVYFETSARSRLVEVEKAQKEVLAHVSVPMFFKDANGGFVEVEEGLKNFHPSREDSVTWSFVGGCAKDRHIEVSGDGAVTVFEASEVKQVALLDEAQCSEFFRKVIVGGLASYSEDAVGLKRELAFKSGLHFPQFVPGGPVPWQARKIQVSIAKFGVNREFSMEDPDYEWESYPDIIEFRSAVEIEKEILGFIP